MSKELEMLKGRLGHIHKTPLEEALDRLYECNDDDYTLGYQQHDYKLLQEALTRLESIDNAKPSEITLRELVSKHILNPNSVVDVFEQAKTEPHYSNRIFMGMAWEMEKHEIGNRKLKYIFSAIAETISESDRVCIEVK